MSFNDPLSPIRLQLMWDRLISVVEEQALTLVRVGFSTSTREAGDLSAGVFDLNGAMLAQAVTGTPGHINSMARAVRHFIAKFPTNTMSRGRHLHHQRSVEGHGPSPRLHVRDPDLPSRQGRRAVCQHLSRRRCRRPRHDRRCGFSLRGRHLHSADAFCTCAALSMKPWSISSRANVREPVQVVGDLYSLATCNEIGCRRLVAMMDEFAIDDLGSARRAISSRSRAQASLEAIRKIKPGVYKYTMRVDGYDKPLDLAATMTISQTGIDVDFTGTSRRRRASASTCRSATPRPIPPSA